MTSQHPMTRDTYDLSESNNGKPFDPLLQLCADFWPCEVTDAQTVVEQRWTRSPVEGGSNIFAVMGTNYLLSSYNYFL